MAADVIIEIGANDDGLREAVDRSARKLGDLDDGLTRVNKSAKGMERSTGKAAKSVDRMGREVDQAGDKADRSRRQLDKFADEAERMNRVSMILGGALGDLTGGLDDFGQLLKSGAGAVTAIGAAGVVATVAFTRFAASIIDTTMNVDELADGFSDSTRKALAPHIEALRQAKNGYEALGEQMTALEVQLAAQATGWGNLSRGIAGVLEMIPETGTGGVTGGLGFLVDKLYEVNPVMAAALEGLVRYGDALNRVDEIQRDLNESTEQFRFDLQPSIGISDPSGFTLTDDEMRTRQTRGPEDNGAALDEIAQTTRLGEAAAETAREVRDLDKAAYDAGTTIRDHYAGGVSFATDVNDLYAESTKRSLQAVAEEWSNHLALVSDVFSNLSFAINTAMDAHVAAQGRGTAAAKKAARQQFAIQKALGITNATINTALAVTQALASSAPPYNFILAGAVAAAGIAEIAIIGAQKQPSFHNGLAPDEQLTYVPSVGPSVTRRNERIAVITDQGMDAMGGRNGVADVNAGRPMGGRVVNYFVLDGDVLPTRQFAGPNADVGHAIPGVR